MWWQSSRVMRLTKGDGNSKYFHTKASNKRCKNRILKLHDENGEWKEGNQLDELIVDYFQSIVSASIQDGPMEFLETLEGCVTDTLNEDLSKDSRWRDLSSSSTNTANKGSWTNKCSQKMPLIFLSKILAYNGKTS